MKKILIVYTILQFHNSIKYQFAMMIFIIMIEKQ